MIRHYFVGFVILSAIGLVEGCKSDSKGEELNSQNSSSKTSVKKVTPLEQTRIYTKEFIDRFVKQIESEDSTGWLELQSKAIREELMATKMTEFSYKAWTKGTLPLLEQIKTKEFKIEQDGKKWRLSLDGVKVISDPEIDYKISLVFEDGKLVIDER